MRSAARSLLLVFALALGACCCPSCEPKHDHQTWSAEIQHQGRRGRGSMQGGGVCGAEGAAQLKARAHHRACHDVCSQIDSRHPDSCDDTCVRESRARFTCAHLRHAHEKRGSTPFWIDLH